MVPVVPGSDTERTDAPFSLTSVFGRRTVTAWLPVRFALTITVPHAKSRRNTLEDTA